MIINEINYWIYDEGKDYILMANDSKIAIFTDYKSVEIFVRDFGITIE